MTLGSTRAPAGAPPRKNDRWMMAMGLALVTIVTGAAGAAPPSKNAPPPSTVPKTGNVPNAGFAPPAASAAAPAASRSPLPWKLGPSQIALGHELTLALPAESQFLAPPEAGKVLEKLGSFHHDNLLGLVTSQADEEWFVTLRYEDEGYIKDDEAIDADELLAAIRDGVAGSNDERVQRGFKALKVEGWSDPPRYDKTRHHLVWALEVSDDDGKSVNFNTRVLGRRGYVSVNLVTAPEKLAEYKPRAATLLGATTFGTGARYEDFDSKTDKVAEYGLAGLVLGGAGLAAAKLVKVGLLAKFSKLILGALIAGKKAIAAGVVALIALLKKAFSGRKAAPAEGPGAPSVPPPAAPPGA
jgi:uncharacterized membrane-anchored protein